MKKQILSLILILTIISSLFSINVYAANDIIQINNVDDLFSLNNNLNSNAILNTDLDIVVDNNLLNKYGAISIGETQAYSGIFEGKGHTITLDINIDRDSYGLFYYLKNAQINNLKIVIKNFQTSSDANEISFSGLAHIIRDSNINANVLYKGNENGQKIAKSNVIGRNIILSALASNCGGNNNIIFTDSFFDLKDIPTDARITFGMAAIINDGRTHVYYKQNKDVNKLEDEKVIIPSLENSYIIGGLIGEIKSGATGTANGSGYVKFLKETTTGKNKDPNYHTTIGGSIGFINRDGIGNVYNGHFTVVGIESFGYSNEFNVGGSVGLNNGKANILHNSSTIYYDSPLITFANESISNNATVNMGGIVGKNSGEIDNHSTAINNLGADIDFYNAKVNFGSIIGYNTRTGIIKLHNNGISLQINKLKYNEDKGSFGYMIGRTDNLNDISLSYNIINAVDEQSFKKDYNFANGPIGNVQEDIIIDGFKNNYLGYMDYAKIGEPSQIYFLIPINYYGNNPPKMDDNDFPLLATYEYMDDENENNQYLSFQNKSIRGIGTLTLSKECVIGTNVNIEVVSPDASSGWTGHYYVYDDILNIKNEDPNETPNDPDDPNNTENPNDPNKENKKHTKPKNPDKNKYSQAVITDEEGYGEPLPTYNSSTDSFVTFNYNDLSFKFIENNFSFTDISNEKYEEDIINAANRLIVKGVGNNLFEPSRPITRAEFATMVVRALGLLPKGDPKFDDVSENQWYYNYINTAASWNIIYGVGDNKFEPDKNITREEAILILTRTAKNIIEENEFNNYFKEQSMFFAEDIEDFSSWAKDGYYDNLEYGIVSLRDNNKIYPKEAITRAETANAILNLLKHFKLINE